MIIVSQFSVIVDDDPSVVKKRIEATMFTHMLVRFSGIKEVYAQAYKNSSWNTAM
jgi:hypothetical protein